MWRFWSDISQMASSQGDSKQNKAEKGRGQSGNYYNKYKNLLTDSSQSLYSFFKILFLSNRHTQCEARTDNPENKSLLLHWMSQASRHLQSLYSYLPQIPFQRTQFSISLFCH